MMKIAVAGLWHLGTVTSACLASLGYRVTAYDPDRRRVGELQDGRPPTFEPGLQALLRSGLRAKRLSFETDIGAALAGAKIVWITFDTPLDDSDRADVSSVVDRVRRLFPGLRSGMIVIVSSQLPVGTTAKLSSDFHRAYPARKVDFCCCPENLILGRSLEAFLRPARLILGTPRAGLRPKLRKALRPLSRRILWTSVESAEMTKHAINAFLASSVSFINELSGLCEATNADAAEVEQGLKSDPRIGPRAYLKPGSAFSGGTLARDLVFLRTLGRRRRRPTPLLDGVWSSNKRHELWTLRRLRQELGNLHGRKVALLGLTYKPGTDTVRRSGAISLALALSSAGARIVGFDPMVRALPDQLARRIPLADSCRSALTGREAALVTTEWPQFLKLRPRELLRWMKRPIVIDPNRFLRSAFENDKRVRYLSVGRE